MKMLKALLLASVLAAAAFTPALAERDDPVTTEPAGSVVIVALKSGGHGSGVHIGDGNFLTAAHVTSDEWEVTLKDDRGVERKADVIWTSKLYDLSLVRLKKVYDAPAIKVEKLSCVEPKVGDEIEAAGSPFDLEFVRTYGRVAGKAVEHKDNWKTAITGAITVGPGMSGGPVFNKAGEVVAFVNAMYIKAPSLAILVPASAACGIMGKKG